MISWQRSPFTADGKFGPVDWDPGEKTGLSIPDGATRRLAQRGMRDAAGSTVCQMYGGTVGAYLNSADLSGQGVDAKGNPLPGSNGYKQMITPSYRFRPDEAIHSSFNENRKTLLLKVRGAEKDVRMLEREVSALTNMQHRRLQEVDTRESGEDHSISFKQLSELKTQLKEKNEHATGLQQRVKTLSHYEAMQKYGPGPHRVEIELEFPGEATPSSFVVEMAPLDVMPHSVDSFLGMVSAGLWDGCSFVMNAVHVIKAAPLPSQEMTAGDKLSAFEREGLNHLAFQEYSEDYPHKQYTLGFSGGDSPSWYVNTEDNTEIHSGDPCFGTVVEGFDTIRKLGTQPTKDGIWYEQRVGIKRARVL